MSVNVAEYFTKFQEEGLSTLKQAQEANLAAFAQVRELGAKFGETPSELPRFENIPPPPPFVEMSFDFATQLLELRKSYTLKIAEIFTETQKQTAEAAVKAAKNVNKL